MQSKEIITAPKTDAITSPDVFDSPSVCGAFNFNIMKEIKLTQGYVAFVDDEDFEYLNQWKWHAFNSRGILYATSYFCARNKQAYRFMHRTIMDTPKNMVVDHIDHNGLNNQRSNLRNCTRSQNGSNRHSSGRSGYLGVTYNGKYISSHIQSKGAVIHLGYCDNEIQAAKRYDAAARFFHGEFANPNFK